MVESAGRTVVCSVLFIDIVEYSKRSVAEQAGIKQQCNGLLTEALQSVAARDRVILDTGDGAAIAFLGDPEEALFIALAIREGADGMPIRMGINLGPARLVKDLNGQVNIIGDGINVAQRVMSFAEPGQLLVSRSYYEVVSCLSTEYAGLFTHEGSRTDKHVRAHEVYSVGTSGTGGQQPIEAIADAVARDPAPLQASVPDGAAKVLDAGTNLIISGPSRTSVQAALDELARNGARQISPITQVSSKWMATCEHPQVAASACKVQSLGFKKIVTGPTREAVAARLAELVRFGAVPVGELQFANGLWTAVCDTSG